MEINYNKLREIQRMVREDSEVVKLSEDFYISAGEYLKELETRRNELDETVSVFAEDARSQIFSELNNARKILIDIFERRERKIVLNALSSARTLDNKPPRDMLDFEVEIYKNMLEQLTKYRKTVLEPILNGRSEKIHSPTQNTANHAKTVEKQDLEQESMGLNGSTKQKVLKTMPILISEEIPSFIWEDGMQYGPFKQGEASHVPLELAWFLINNDKAIMNESSKDPAEVLSSLQESRNTQDYKSEN